MNQNEQSVLTQSQVAALMTERGYPMSRSRVDQIEQKALAKIALDPLIRKMAVDFGLDPNLIIPRARRK